MIRLLQGVLHAHVVGHAVSLHSLGVDGGTLTQIQGAALYGHGVGTLAHLSAQGVDLVDQMSLGRPADGGIAGHIGDLIQRQGEQYRIHAHARRGQGRLTARVPRADHRNRGFCDLILIHMISLFYQLLPVIS